MTIILTVASLPSLIALIPHTTRVLPIGDSITWGALPEGAAPEGGYRKPLAELLRTSGHKVQFVGSLHDRSFADDANEGHIGWTSGQLREIAPVTVLRYQPDIVLLMVGTNDLAHGDDLATSRRNLDTLLDALEPWYHPTTVYVASVLPVNNGRAMPLATADRVTAFNTQLKSIVAAHAARWQQVHYVNMTERSGIDESDFWDGVHPNASGYGKIADTWYRAVAW